MRLAFKIFAATLLAKFWCLYFAKIVVYRQVSARKNWIEDPNFLATLSVMGITNF